MNPYHKINSIYKRDLSLPNKPFILGEYTCKEFEYLKDNQWIWTEKIDGMNIRIIYNLTSVEFRGKSDNAQIPKPLLEKLEELFPFNKIAEYFQDKEICLYGEGFGYKIQGKIGQDYIGKENDFYLFDVKIGNFWLEQNNVNRIAEELDIRPTIVIGQGTFDQAIQYVKSGVKSLIGNADMEGLVLRPAITLFSRKGERIITKVKYRDFRE